MRQPNGGSAEVVIDMRVKVPKTLHDELVKNLSKPEINRVLVESLHEALRKLRFRHDLARTTQRHHKK